MTRRRRKAHQLNENGEEESPGAGVTEEDHNEFRPEHEGTHGMQKEKSTTPVNPSPGSVKNSPMKASRKGNSKQINDARMLEGSYWLTRIVIVRALALLYAVAFSVALLQNDSLLGSRGLTPACQYMRRIAADAGLQNATILDKFLSFPTILWATGCSDQTLRAIPAAGLIISAIVLFNGGSNFFCMLALWVLYHSINTVGQRWYGFGWESQLLETGFLGMWLVPFFSLDNVAKGSPPRHIIIWAYRWLIMRIMFGAGLIKVRGDQCWRDLTCMLYHYETQPIPNPLSWFYHYSPTIVHRLETLVNHFVELVAPFLLLMPRNWRIVGGIIQVVFQVILISSGNLSFLNYLTIIPALASFDDQFFSQFFSKSTVGKVRDAEVFWNGQKPHNIKAQQGIIFTTRKYCRLLISTIVGLLVCYLSIPVVNNMLSPRQAMNRGFDPLLIVNTYGAFGSIGKTRPEIVLEGTNASDYLSLSAEWIPYEFPCKPGDISRRPCFISPYHLRMDWLMWFAAMGNYQQYPWLVKLVDNLLKGDESMHSFFVDNPFPDSSSPPTALRAGLWEYRFIPPGWNAIPKILGNGTMFLYADRIMQLDFPTQWDWPPSDECVIIDKRVSSKSSHSGDEVQKMESREGNYVEIGDYWVRRYIASYIPPIDPNNESVRKFLKQTGMK